MVEKAEAKSEGGNEFQQWHRSVAALLIWSEEKDAVWSLSFLGQIMEPNFGSMFPFFQEKNKDQGMKWKLILFPSSLFILTNDTCAILLCFNLSLLL